MSTEKGEPPAEVEARKAAVERNQAALAVPSANTERELIKSLLDQLVENDHISVGGYDQEIYFSEGIVDFIQQWLHEHKAELLKG